jgi:hypothetical protein
MEAPFANMRRLYRRGKDARGLVIDRDGVMLGPDCVLIEHSGGDYRMVWRSGLRWLARDTLGSAPGLERLPIVLDRIAVALAAGDLVKAQLLGLEIPLGELDDRRLRRLRFAADLLKAGFDPSQARDERGRWTSDGDAPSVGDDLQSDLLPASFVQPAEPSERPPNNAPETKGPPPIDMWDITDDRKKPVKFLDDAGKEILGPDGKPMWRPKDLDPHMFIERALAAAEAYRSSKQFRSSSPDTTPLVFDPFILDTSQFRTGGPWDAQRVDGIPVRQYRDYATVAIGLYGAAAAIPLDEMLTQENEYACLRSRFRFDLEERDPVYSCLPKRNVENTKLGYRLYESGRIGHSRSE